MKRTGFTLIELLVVSTIIIVMAVLAVPSYNRYSAQVEFQQKTDEVKQIIDQAKTFAGSPDKGVFRYEVETRGSSIILLRDGAEQKTITMPKNVTIEIDSSKADRSYYTCDVAQEVCCLFKNSERGGICDSKSAFLATGDWLQIKNNKLDLGKKIYFSNQIVSIRNE